MKRLLIILSSLLVWVFIILYFVFASNLSAKRQRGAVIERVNIVIIDSLIQRVITPSMVLAWFSIDKYQLINREIATLNTIEVKEFVERRKFVKHASAYVDMSGSLNIEIEQRIPVARFNTENGYNFYITDDNYILPLQNHEVMYVPIITGNFAPPFSSKFIGKWTDQNDEIEKKTSENYKFFKKLINFVNVTRDDMFLSSLIVQFNVVGRGSLDGNVVLKESEIELVPRVGNHIIRLGTLDNIEHKLDKLLLFYKRSASNDLWNTPTYINLEYKGQIVCRKM